jgi:hypothetical protein
LKKQRAIERMKGRRGNRGPKREQKAVEGQRDLQGRAEG